jgi:GNAT superfamily N-acetyltransferase
MVFDYLYQEDIALRNGQRVRLRTVLPTDKERLVEGLEKLSPDARLARFFTPKQRFTAEELSYLTELDIEDHYALGAVLLNDDGTEGAGIGVARFVRLEENPASAEPAVTVLDEWQNQGLGKILFHRLVAAARERGIRYFHTEFLAGNDAIQRLLEGICPDLMIWQRGSELVADVPLPDIADLPGSDTSESVCAAILRLAAQKLIQMRSLRRKGHACETRARQDRPAEATDG